MCPRNWRLLVVGWVVRCQMLIYQALDMLTIRKEWIFKVLKGSHKRYEIPLPTSLAWALSQVKSAKEYLLKRNVRIDFLPGRLWRRGWSKEDFGVRWWVLCNKSPPQEPMVLQVILPILNALAFNWFSCENRSSCPVSLTSWVQSRVNLCSLNLFMGYYLNKRISNCWELPLGICILPWVVNFPTMAFWSSKSNFPNHV